MQVEKWREEYLTAKNLPSSRTQKPSSALVQFIEQQHPTPGTALDIGCGLGRNSFYLASLGYQVFGYDPVVEAIEQAKTVAADSPYGSHIQFDSFSAGQPNWPLADNEFSLAVDMMVLHVLNLEERSNYARELARVMQPRSYFLFYTIAADSPAAQELFTTHPGPEINSYVIPQSGMIEKAFTEQDLTALFDEFSLCALEKKTAFTPAFGDVYERVYYSGVMQRK